MKGGPMISGAGVVPGDLSYTLRNAIVMDDHDKCVITLRRCANRKQQKKIGNRFHEKVKSTLLFKIFKFQGALN